MPSADPLAPIGSGKRRVIALTLPQILQTPDFCLHQFHRDAAVLCQSGQTGDARRQIAEIAAPCRLSGQGKCQIALPRFLIEAHKPPQFLPHPQQLLLNVRLYVFAPLGQAWQCVLPNIDARIQILAKSPRCHFGAQVFVCARNQLKLAAAGRVAAHGEKFFFFDGFEQHRLFIHAQFANFIQKQHPQVSAFEKACAAVGSACKRAFAMAKQSGRRHVAAQSGAIDIDKAARYQMAGFFQFIYALGEHGFACACGPIEQNRRW